MNGRLALHLASLAIHSTVQRKQKELASMGLAWHQLIAALRRMEEMGCLDVHRASRPTAGRMDTSTGGRYRNHPF